MSFLSVLPIAFAFLGLSTGDDEEPVGDVPLEGHSHQGDAFNEGPRQAAYLLPDPGTVNFAVTTDSEESQAFFNQGIGALHGFWYFEAERSFRQAAALDPELALAYWGMSLANVENEERAADFAHEAWLRRDAASERERMHIDALAEYYAVDKAEPAKGGKASTKKLEKKPAEKLEGKADGKPEGKKPKQDGIRGKKYVEALEAILWKYPDDIETKALLVNFLWMGRYKDMPTVSKLAVEALLQDIFEVQPMHPAHHYRIHLWDDEETAERALDSAVDAGHSWPTIAHQWHMGGHIFDRLGRYIDAAWQQEASARVDHAHMQRDRVLPDQIHNFAHNNEWLVRSWNHCGRMRESIDLAQNMIELPRHPDWNMLDEAGCSASYGRDRLLGTLELFEQWEELVRLCGTMYLEPSGEASDEAKRLVMLGEAHAFLGEFDAARAQVEALEALIEKQRAARAEAVDAAEEQALSEDESATEMREVMVAALEEHEAPLRNLRKNVAALEGLVLVLETEPKELPVDEPAETEDEEDADDDKADADVDDDEADDAGDDDEDEQEAEEADEAADGKAETTDTAKKPRRPKRAAPEYDEAVEDALKALRKGSLPKSHLARVHLRLGLRDQAEELARDEVEDAENSVVPLATLAHVLFELGEIDEALEVFGELRLRSSHLDLDAPPFARLAPLARHAGHAADWRVPYVEADDVGDRPELDSLGPRRWSPTPALPWTVTDAEGNARSLADYEGRPVIVILFLGFGCIHCVEQLEAFGPVADDFTDAGISLVTIGTDDREHVAEALAALRDEERPPFPILCDPELEVFHAWRAFDDFEEMPLHGTFLVDAQGRVRWQDISYEPFVDHEFLLAESKRLLGLPPLPTALSSAGASSSSGGAR